MGKTVINIFSKSLLLPGLFCSLMVSATEGRSEGQRHLSVEQDVAKAELVRLNVPAGEIEVVGIAGDKVIAEATAVCENAAADACHRLLNEMAWIQKAGSVAELSLSPAGVSEYNQVKMKVKLGVPRDKNLEVNMGAGELSISDTSACLRAELNAGQLNIALAESQLAAISLSAMVGDAKLITAKGDSISGKRSALVGAQLEWAGGSGACHVHAKVLAGETKLTFK